MQRFAIHYTPGTSWKIDEPWQQQGLYDHGEYMDELFASGILLYGGPFDDHRGGLAIVEVNSSADAQRIIEQDPAVRDGIFQASAHPWITVFDQPRKTNHFKKRLSDGDVSP